jgi:RNA polymerase sigma factor (sigma-70 family)
MAEAEPYADVPPLESDITILHQYARSQEPAAFVELSRRYAGVVYGTCLRITANVHDAEELTQDCFFELARRAATVRSSVGGWLHSLATNRALNAVRSRNRRREHEQDAAVARSGADSESEVAWSRLEPLLDQAIDDLPEELRTAIILHFLENRPQSEVAARLGVHQSTISRRIQEALDALRARLRESGLVMAVAPLASLLATHAHSTADPHLLASLAKIALAGIGSTATGKAIGGVGIVLAKLSTWGKALGALAAPVFVQLLLGGWWGFLLAVVFLVYIAWRQPKWHEELSIAMVGRGYHYEFFPLARWTWTTPPAGWRKAIIQALIASAVMGVLAVASVSQFAIGWAAMMALYTAMPLSTAIRIWIRVQACPAGTKDQGPSSTVAPPDGITIVQHACSCLAITLWVASFSLLKIRSPQQAAVLGWGIPIAMSIAISWEFADTIGTIVAYRLRKRRKQAQEDVHPRIASLSNTSRPRATLGALLFILVAAGAWTWSALNQYLLFPSDTPFLPVDVMRMCFAWASWPPVTLMFLVFTIRLFARLRPKMAGVFWWSLATFAILCVLVNLFLLMVWLLPRTIENQDPEMRRVRNAIMQGDMGVLRNPIAMPELRKALDNPNKEVRSRAAWAFAEIGSEAKEFVPKLREVLGDEDSEVRSMAAYALSRMGTAAKTAVPELRKAMRDQDKNVRRMATYAMGRIGRETQDAVPELRMALGDEDKDTRWNAAWALGAIGPAAKDAVPELRKAMSDPDSGVRSNVAFALGHIGPTAKDAVPELRRAMNDPIKWVRSDAACALGQIDPTVKDAVPGLQGRTIKTSNPEPPSR